MDNYSKEISHGVTISKTPHPRQIKQQTSKQFYQLCSRKFHVIKSTTLPFLPQCIKHNKTKFQISKGTVRIVWLND